MSITIANLVANFDTYIGDTSNDRVTAAERLQYFTEATVWLQETLENDLQNSTYSLDYLDSVNNYKVTTAVADLLTGADLRRDKDSHVLSFTHKGSRELAEEIGSEFTESSWGIERRDTNTYLVISYGSEFSAKVIADFNSLDSGGGTWALDATNGDGTNLTLDTNEKKQGSGSLNFDIDVSQTANNKAVLSNTTLTSSDLTEHEDLSSWLLWVYIPDVTNFTSITLYWGSDTSNYWSATTTTDIDGSAWVDGWNRVKINWADATKTASPDVTAMTYSQVDFNYGAGQGDDTDFRVDELLVVRPEKLKFHYLSWNVGVDTSGDDITAFGATTDVPYFSGMYDQYKYTVAHKAAELAFRSLRLKEAADEEEGEAERSLQRARKIIPSSKSVEVKSFKIRGVNFRGRKEARRRRIVFRNI